MVLRTMQRAHYHPEPRGHYALASRYYAHFTSPIRRYPDLIVLRGLDLIPTSIGTEPGGKGKGKGKGKGNGKGGRREREGGGGGRRGRGADDRGASKSRSGRRHK